MITTTIPTNLDFPNRGVLERDDFVNAQETAQDLLAGAYTTALNQYATELNSTQAEINLKAEQVASQAVDGGYSQTYINTTFTPKILNTQTDKTTPVDTDLIPLSDSAASFGLKKLSWLNIKNTLKTYFDALYTIVSSETVAGIIEIATTAEAQAGTDDLRAITSLKLKKMLDYRGITAMASVSNAPSISGVINFSSVSFGADSFTLTFAEPMDNTTYIVQITHNNIAFDTVTGGGSGVQEKTLTYVKCRVAAGSPYGYQAPFMVAVFGGKN